MVTYLGIPRSDSFCRGMGTTAAGLVWTLCSLLHVLSFYVASSTAEPCESGWVAGEAGQCYWFVIPATLPGSLNNAVRYCRQQRAEVVLIDDAEENKFVAEELKKLDEKGRCFLGVQDYWSEGTFLTLHGDPIPYRNFTGSEPDDGGTDTFRENCVFLFAKSGLWKDQTCTGNTKVNAYVCERNLHHRRVNRLTVVPAARLDDAGCQLESHTVASPIECARKYLDSQVALSFNVARTMAIQSPNCHIMTCRPMDVATVTADPDWTLYHFPEIF